jgi:hypothetical protein
MSNAILTSMQNWQLFDDKRFALQFKYPSKTPQGSLIDRTEGQHDETIRVHFISRDSEELYFEVTKYHGLPPREEYRRHKEELKKRFTELSITDIQEINWKSLPAYEYSFDGPPGRRSVTMFEKNEVTYRILYDPRSPLNLQVLSTVEWIDDVSSPGTVT